MSQLLIILPNGFISPKNKKEKSLIKNLLDNNELKGIIRLSRQTFKQSKVEIGTVICHLQTERRRKDIFYSDVSQISPNQQTQKSLNNYQKWTKKPNSGISKQRIIQHDYEIREVYWEEKHAELFKPPTPEQRAKQIKQVKEHDLKLIKHWEEVMRPQMDEYVSELKKKWNF